MEVRITIDGDLAKKKIVSGLTWKSLIYLGFQALEERKTFNQKINSMNDELEKTKLRCGRLAQMLSELMQNEEKRKKS